MVEESPQLKVVQMSDHRDGEPEEDGEDPHGYVELTRVCVKTFSNGKPGIEVAIEYSIRDLDELAVEVASAYMQIDGMLGTWALQRESEIHSAAAAEGETVE
jgi:hypothetical protein